MPSRGFLVPAIILWFASTTWLVTTKILPTLSSGSPPDYQEILPRRPLTLDPVRWTIRWNEREIGWAENRISRSVDGTGRVVSEVKFRQLPVAQLIKDVMGVAGRLAGPLLMEDLGPIDLHVITSFNFDSYSTLDRFETLVDVGTMPELLQIEGRIDGETLQLTARVQPSAGGRREIFRDQIRLPPDALMADTFSPRPRLANLRLGQTWTFQSYRPLMPHSPLELVEARVEHEELIEWQGQLVKTKLVAYRRDAGSGLVSTRTPISKAWVTADGTVLRQDVWLAGVRIQFVRQPPSVDTADLSETGGRRVAGDARSDDGDDD